MDDLDDKPVRRNGVRRERWAILGVVVLLLVAVAAPQAFRKSKHPPLPDDGPPLKPSTAGELRGMTLQLHSHWEGIPFEQYVEEIAQTGANTICLSLAAYQENATSNSLFIEYRKVPSLKRFKNLIKLAHRRGLRVVVMPIVLLENPRHREWRGRINPPDQKRWWGHYESYILFYARAAAETEAEVFMIGSELVDMEDKTRRWEQLIREVRKVYKGKLSYSANWDHYKDIKWWKELDLIGMTVYYDLVGKKEPTMEVLMESWKPIKEKILAWQRKEGRKPILFTEVGWPNQVGCAKEPWNYYGNPDKPDPTAQANCFKAFFETWRGEKTVAGVLIWEWRNHPTKVGGMEDTSYIPTGKPAMQVIRSYFGSPGALPRTAPATTSAPTTAPATKPVAATKPAE
jgi:hypothetical protein